MTRYLYGPGRWRVAGLVVLLGAVLVYALSAIWGAPAAQRADAAPLPTTHPPQAPAVSSAPAAIPSTASSAPGSGEGAAVQNRSGSASSGENQQVPAACPSGTGGSLAPPGDAGPGDQPIVVVIPPGLIGAADGLPAVVSRNWSGRTRIAVWVACGINGARITVVASGRGVWVHECKGLHLAAGRITTVSCPVTAHRISASPASFTLTVTVTAGRQVLARHGFRHLWQ